MRHLILILLLLATLTNSGFAQTRKGTPQSARQALIEMFLAKGGDNFIKHIPDDTRKALLRGGEAPESSMIFRFASLAAMGPLGQQFETFDSGPNILVSDLPNENKRIEVAIEHDISLGDSEEIELSVHVYADGQEESMQIVPRLIFTLGQENNIWRLDEVTFAAHVPLTDPRYINGLRKRQDEIDESAVQSRITMIAQAETSYAEEHPEFGYTCSLAKLFPPPSGNPEEPAYYDPSFLREEVNGYRFSLTGCNGIPAGRFAITAVPIDSDSSMKSFCVDQSGTTKWIAGGPISSCFSNGESISDGSDAGVME